jgi:hypothetical protein
MWKMWLTPLRFPKQMQPGRVQLLYRSPSANDTPVRTVKWTTFSNIRGNGVRLNGIAARGNEDLSSDSPQIHFSVPQDDATARIAYSAEQEVATAQRVLGVMRRHLINRTIFCERAKRVSANPFSDQRNIFHRYMLGL